jgi:hypothetical protein
MKKAAFCEVSVAGTVYRLGEGAKATAGIITLSDGRMGQIRIGMGRVIPTCWVVWLKPPKESPQGKKKRRVGRDTCCRKCERICNRIGERCMKDPATCKGRTNGDVRCKVCREYKEKEKTGR